MTLIRQKIVIRKVKDITVGSALFFAILGGTFSLQSCVTTQPVTGNYEVDNNGEAGDTLMTGIRSYINEVSAGKFQIMDEINVPLDSTQAFISRLNGRKDTLNLDVAKLLIDAYLHEHSDEIGQNNSLENALLFGGIGHLLAQKTPDNEYAYYQNKLTKEPPAYEPDSTENLWNQPFYTNQRYYPNFFLRFYFSPTIYTHSLASYERIRGPRMTFSRPYHSSSGHFHRSSYPTHVS